MRLTISAMSAHNTKKAMTAKIQTKSKLLTIN